MKVLVLRLKLKIIRLKLKLIRPKTKLVRPKVKVFVLKLRMKLKMPIMKVLVLRLKLKTIWVKHKLIRPKLKLARPKLSIWLKLKVLKLKMKVFRPNMTHDNEDSALHYRFEVFDEGFLNDEVLLTDEFFLNNGVDFGGVIFPEVLETEEAGSQTKNKGGQAKEN